MPLDLHSFVRDYGKLHPEEFLTIDSPIDYRYEGTALIAKLERLKRFPVVIFNDVRRDGERSDMPLITWEHGSRLRMARLLGTTVEQAGVACYEAMRAPRDPVVVDRGEAPVQELVLHGDDVDLRKLPVFVHHEMDPGPYVTAGFLTTYDPDSGRENSAIQRGWISGPREIRFYVEPHTHNAINLAKYEERNEPMPIAFWVGHHPLAVLGCSVSVPYDGSHYAMAGSFLGEPLRLVPSASLGDDFLVPADAEVVIEGMVRLGERRPEGPFGEYPRHMGQQRWSPFFEVTALTRREDAYWQSVMCGYTHWISSLRAEGKALETIKRVVPGVRNVHLAMSGAGNFNLYIQIRQTSPGQGKLALMSGLTSNFLIKNAFVFDEDIDIFDDKDVMIGFSTRFQGERDQIIVTDCAGSALDPSAPYGGQDTRGTKMGFDCTKPVSPEPFPPRTTVPADVMSRINVEDFISPEQLNRIPFEIYG
jgi:2,5-furandicarboxylate decarboxylase 1